MSTEDTSLDLALALREHAELVGGDAARLMVRAAIRLEGAEAAYERLAARRDRQAETGRKAWLNAAEAVLAALPGASNSTHPAYGLWLRVQMAKAEPVQLVLSSIRSTKP